MWVVGLWQCSWCREPTIDFHVRRLALSSQQRSAALSSSRRRVNGIFSRNRLTITASIGEYKNKIGNQDAHAVTGRILQGWTKALGLTYLWADAYWLEIYNID